MQKVFGLKVDTRALDWALLIQHTAVADIGPHGKRHRFVLGPFQLLLSLALHLAPGTLPVLLQGDVRIQRWTAGIGVG